MEHQTILLLSKSTEALADITTCLSPLRCVIQQATSNKLMLTIYKLNAKLLIIDLDDYQSSVLDVLDSIQVSDYLPILYIFSKPYDAHTATLLHGEILLHKGMLSYSLLSITKKSLDFKAKYDHVVECYSAIDSINSQTDQILRKYIGSEFSNYKDSLLELLEYVFASNRFLSNKPSSILIVYKQGMDTFGQIYSFGGDAVRKKCAPILLSRGDSLPLQTTAQSEFYRNCGEQEISDIGDYHAFFTKEVTTELGFIRNFTGYTTTDTAIIAINYERHVTSFDADIIKGLCISYNLMENIYHQITQVQDSFIYTMDALARAAEANDDNTGHHIKRVNEFSKLISEHLGMDKKYIDTIYISAQMHDVGKVHIPKDILCKPGKLTDEEFTFMQQHTTYGALIIGGSPHLEMATDIALYHHERFDGTGYPHRKRGEEIPLSARIVTMADIYDALRTARCYKPAFDHAKTYDIIVNGDGRVIPSHFDPSVYEIFKAYHRQFDEIYSTWG